LIPGVHGVGELNFGTNWSIITCALFKPK